MKIKEMLGTLQPGKKQEKPAQLWTKWGEEVKNECEALDYVPLPEYPRPQMRREDYTVLNGWWEYRIASFSWGKILVPFSPESVLSRVSRQLQPDEELWYRRNVQISEDEYQMHRAKKDRLLLQFCAVDQECRVYWNGHLVGSHRGGYLAFTMEVTEFVRPGANELQVICTDESDTGAEARGKQKLQPGGMFYTAQSGIWQTVWMEWVPQRSVEWIKIMPQPDEGVVRIRVRVSAQGQSAELLNTENSIEKFQTENVESDKDGTQKRNVNETEKNRATKNSDLNKENADMGSESITCTYMPEQIFITISYEENTEEKLQISCIPSRRGTGWTDYDAAIAIQNAKLWSPEHPFLYDLEICAGEDHVKSYFAMRTFSVEPDERGIPRFCLNHQPYFLNGVLDQGYWPEGLYTAPTDEALVSDIERMKECGLRLLRKHCKLEPMRWYYHCDRLGMLVWQDMVNGGETYDMNRICYLPTLLHSFQTKKATVKLHADEKTGRAAKRGNEIVYRLCGSFLM